MVFVLEDKVKILADRSINPESEYEVRHKRKNGTTTAYVAGIFSELVGILDILIHPAVFNPLFHGNAIVFSEAILNSALWGNKERRGTHITLDIYLGSDMKTSAVFIEDQGSGFNYQEVIDSLGTGEQVYQLGGSGMRNFQRSPFHIAYHGPGNIISIATPLN